MTNTQQARNDTELAMLAVNSYEAQVELIGRLTEALTKLANEASGFRCMADIERHGATNMRVLGDRVTEAFEVLAEAAALKAMAQPTRKPLPCPRCGKALIHHTLAGAKSCLWELAQILTPEEQARKRG